MTLIQIKSVSKQYATVNAVKNVSFDVAQGEIFALLGPNGAGKSSLVRMLVGFTQPDSGEICIELEGSSYSSIPNRFLGYLPEDRGLYPEKTVYQNLLYLSRLKGVVKEDATQRINHWLDKFDLLGRKFDQLKSLSKGNQQKVQLITAVIHQPSIVLLDEPFSGLDPINQEKVVEFLAELKQQGMTVILSAHQMAMIEKLADRVLLMNRGEVVLQGSLKEVMAKMEAKNELVVTFKTPVEINDLVQVSNGAKCVSISEQKYSFELTARQSLSALVRSVSQLSEITEISSNAQDLHELYLAAIAEHQRSLDISSGELNDK